MKKQLWVLFVVVMFLGIPIVVSALDVDISVQAGGGMAMGTTDDDLKSGKLRWSASAGLAIDAYAFELRDLSLGLSTGADYALMNYYGIADMSGFGVGDRVSESRYNYLFIPVALVGNIKLQKEKSVTVRIGGFAAYFLGGTVDLTYDTPGFPFVNGEVDYDDSNTEQWMYGLRAYIGASLFQKGKVSIAPGIQFDMGLTDTSIDSVQPLPSKDTFWALNAIVSLKYGAF